MQFNERFRYGFPVFARSCPSHWWPSGADEVLQGYASSSEESGGEAGLAMFAAAIFFEKPLSRSRKPCRCFSHRRNGFAPLASSSTGCSPTIHSPLKLLALTKRVKKVDSLAQGVRNMRQAGLQHAKDQQLH